VENFKEENRNLKQNSTLLVKETEELRNEAKQQDRRIEQLMKLEDECHRLQEENLSALRDSQALQEQFETVFLEKENLEYQTQEAMQALSDERESRSLLEAKLSEDQRVSPINTHWEDDRRERKGNCVTRDDSRQLSSVSADEGGIESTPSPIPRNGEGFVAKFHSTPYAGNPPSLLSEIQDSFMAESDKEEMEGLKRRIAEMEEVVSSNKNEKHILEESVKASSAREAKQVKEMESLKEKFAKEICDKDQKIDELSQRVNIRDEQIEQIRGKLSMTTAERTSLEIEVDGLNNEIQRVKVTSALDIDKCQRECAQEQTKNIKLSSHISVLEEQAAEFGKTIQKLENIVFNSHAELATMTEDIRSLQKAVTTLTVDAKSSPTTTTTTKQSGNGISQETMNGRDGQPALTNGGVGDEEDEGYYSLKIQSRKSSVQVHEESSSLRSITNLREQLKLVRSPLELFTKAMLERSLAHSAKYAPPTSSSPDPTGTNRKNTLDLEATISKWKSKFMHKTEELNNLRSIMKARATTAEVATSSLRSKLEGQARAYQTELTKLRYQIKILKKEKDEHLSLRTMYAKRCDDYIDEITRVKKETEHLQQEFDSLYVCLEKTIKRKLELSTELEEYKMDEERKTLIPKLLESSRV
jgi:protein bicaudal D